MTQLRNIEWSYSGDKYSVILAIVIVILYFVISFATIAVLCRHSRKETIETDAFQKKYGALVSDLRLSKGHRMSLAVPIFVWIRASSIVIQLFSDSTTV